ncbi:hypothetical protein [Streptomyces sp. NPDC048332]|uniref:hypothetical protein n=1 Tax=Streptomyces sp. NPDC048332 TaxID=3154619 RepID=UPI0034287CB2
MSLQDHVDNQTEPREKARLAILSAIAEQAEATKDFTAQAAAPALRDLAEAYAWIASPGNSH